MLGIFNILPIYPLDGGQIVYNAGLLIFKRQATARAFSLTLACLGAFAFLWWRSAGFTDFNHITYSLVLIGWLLFNAFTHLR